MVEEFIDCDSLFWVSIYYKNYVCGEWFYFFLYVVFLLVYN